MLTTSSSSNTTATTAAVAILAFAIKPAKHYFPGDCLHIKI